MIGREAGNETWNDPYKPANWWFPMRGPPKKCCSTFLLAPVKIIQKRYPRKKTRRTRTLITLTPNDYNGSQIADSASVPVLFICKWFMIPGMILLTSPPGLDLPFHQLACDRGVPLNGKWSNPEPPLSCSMCKGWESKMRPLAKKGRPQGRGSFWLRLCPMFRREVQEQLARDSGP